LKYTIFVKSGSCKHLKGEPLITIIALLRGINVGGHNRLPMRDLVTILQEMGLQHVQTYIQSGNVVFETDRTDLVALSEEICGAIAKQHGFSPYVMLLKLSDLQAAVAANPFPEGEEVPKSLHFFFLDQAPEHPDLSKLEAVKMESERYELIDKVFYLHAPDGIGRSKLAAKVGNGWNVTVTARNWRTVSKIMEMATAVA
jgi:uncharacterized protein (DUF1697 family)